MTGKDLLEAMSWIDERFIDEADRCGLPGRIYAPWLRIVSVAACLCLVMLSLWCIQPLLSDPNGTIPPTTFLPEGFMEVILYVDEMTEDGFQGTVAELVTPELFAVGMELKVQIEEEAWYERADGSSGRFADLQIDCSGCYVLVQCIEYDPDTASIVAGYLMEVEPPECVPQKG